MKGKYIPRSLEMAVIVTKRLVIGKDSPDPLHFDGQVCW